MLETGICSVNSFGALSIAFNGLAEDFESPFKSRIQHVQLLPVDARSVCLGIDKGRLKKPMPNKRKGQNISGTILDGKMLSLKNCIAEISLTSWYCQEPADWKETRERLNSC
jgi:hypothetical protein